MTAIVVIGIELSARTQVGLLAAEIVTLAAVRGRRPGQGLRRRRRPARSHPSLSWFNPFASAPASISAGMLLAVFIYWGWDTTATVNEETEDSREAPGQGDGRSAPLILLGIYVIVAVAAQAYAGVDELNANQEDVLSALGTEVFGSPLDKILIIAVLTSAAASTQTTILPTRADDALDGARQRDAEEPRQGPPALPHPAHLDHPDGRRLDRLVRRADAGQRRHPLRLARRTRPDDRLLHRR